MINLYKNGILELSLEGIVSDNQFICDGVVYDIKNMTLIRKQDGYKLTLDFINNKGIIELIEYNQSLPLKIEIMKKEINNEKHKVEYKIETEEDILNEFEVIF